MSIHGHEVMRMMVEAGRPFTESELEKVIVQKFGAQARFMPVQLQKWHPKN